MKHIHSISKDAPAKAILGFGHPGVVDSLSAFFKDPIGVIAVHINWLFGRGGDN